MELLTETSTTKKNRSSDTMLLLGGFRLERHNNHIATSVERKEITVINCPDCGSSGLADCFLFFVVLFFS